jgi:hypothetical protein
MGLVVRVVLFALAVATILTARAGPVSNCVVPDTHPTLGDALADANCISIMLPAGRHMGDRITRSVALIGAGASTTIIESSLPVPAVEVDGAAASVSLQNLRLEAGNGPEPVLQTINGGQISLGQNIQVGVGRFLFNDGFEGN